MKFRIKSWSKGEKDRSKFSTEETDANNELELKSAYGVMGYDVEIVERLGNPTPVNNTNISNTDEHPDNPVPNAQPVPPPPKELTFKDGDMEYKICGSEVFKKDWIELNGEYRVKISTEHVGEYKGKDYIVEIKDWVKVTK